MKLDKNGSMKKSGELSRHYKIKAVLTDIKNFGKTRFFRLFREGKIAIPVRDCSKVKDEDLDNMLDEVLRVNFDEDAGI